MEGEQVASGEGRWGMRELAEQMARDEWEGRRVRVKVDLQKDLGAKKSERMVSPGGGRVR